MIGLMASMMVMELKHGHGVAGIEGSIGKALDMVLECIGFIRVMCTLGNGLVGRAMGVAFIPVRMVVVMWESLSGVLNTVLDTIISGMEIDMQESILQIKCMDLESTVLQMAIVMKVPGTRGGDRGMECTHLEMVKLSLATGKMESLIFQAHRAMFILFLLLLSITLRCLMLFRKLDEQQKRPMRLARWTRE